ncbi:hypothetical protein pb186bvf_000232 [Paramecium bursaria]
MDQEKPQQSVKCSLLEDHQITNEISSNYKNNQNEKQKLQILQQDESEITNIYDLEQLNYRLFMNKEYERSLKLSQRLMKIQRNPEYYHHYSLTYLALNDIDNAQKWYDSSISIGPYYIKYFFDYEIAVYSIITFSDSIKYIQNNLDCYKEQENQLIAECLFAYNVCLSQRPQKAIKMLMTLIQRYPKCYLPYFYTTKCYYHIEDYYQALEFINQAIMCFKYNDIQLYNLKGNNYQYIRKNFDLEWRFQWQSYFIMLDALRVYQLFPNNEYFKEQAEVVKTKIHIERIKQELKIQKVVIKQLGKLERQFQEQGFLILQTLGIDYYKQRKYEESRDCLLRALEQNPNNGLCQLMITKCYLKLGDFDNAQEHSNMAGSFYDDGLRVVKLLKKIDNERSRSEIQIHKRYQNRIFS